jgi:hypothetical protein
LHHSLAAFQHGHETGNKAKKPQGDGLTGPKSVTKRLRLIEIAVPKPSLQQRNPLNMCGWGKGVAKASQDALKKKWFGAGLEKEGGRFGGPESERAPDCIVGCSQCPNLTQVVGPPFTKDHPPLAPVGESEGSIHPPRHYLLGMMEDGKIGGTKPLPQESFPRCDATTLLQSIRVRKESPSLGRPTHNHNRTH